MQRQLDEIIDFRQFFFKILKNWFFFILSIALCLIIAFTYNRYSHELYSSETSILIKEENTMITASDLLYENSLSNKQKSLENKTLMLKSFPLIYSTLQQLKYDIAYFIVGNIMVTESFHAPVIVTCNNVKLLAGKSVTIEIINDNEFLFNHNDKKTRMNFGNEFSFYNTSLVVDKNPRYKISSVEVPSTVVKFRNLISLAQNYQNKIKIYQNDKKSTVINISILEEDQLKGVYFLNQLTENYINQEIDEKNTASINTVNFINKQLMEMSDSLSLIEQRIQDYKNNNNITDLSLKAQSIYSNIVTVETDLAKQRRVNSYYNYLENYIEKGEDLEGIRVPTAFGVDDASLNLLITQLVEIQIKKNILIDGGQVNNPAIAQYNRETKQLMLNLLEAISSSRSANAVIIKDLDSRISKMESELSDIPQVERELLSIERLQSISENIYIFLLQKRAEAMITSSSNVS